VTKLFVVSRYLINDIFCCYHMSHYHIISFLYLPFAVVHHLILLLDICGGASYHLFFTACHCCSDVYHLFGLTQRTELHSTTTLKN
jgi:hypothetical protein